ncbi:hypothetical protein DH2020_030664 [Rehmannia glutinosa]|uniref:Uncharacterized protein n=1 Tax=Rehmannia glutinosa TaxID=99300 RepID=A0ABR0VN39_REHGL
MSSWIPSLFNPFLMMIIPPHPTLPHPTKTTPRSPSSGAKDDISAVFAVSPPFLRRRSPSLPGPSSSSGEIAGIRNDLAEIQGSFRSGLSLNEEDSELLSTPQAKSVI